MNQKKLTYKIFVLPLSILLFCVNCEGRIYRMRANHCDLNGRCSDHSNELLLANKEEDKNKEEDTKQNNENRQSLKEEILTKPNDEEQKESSDKPKDQKQGKGESVLLEMKNQLLSIENQVNINTLNIENEEKKNSFYNKINDFVQKLKTDCELTKQALALHLFINQRAHKVFENRNVCKCKIIMYYTATGRLYRKALISMIKFELYAKDNKESPMCVFNDQELLGYQMELKGDHYLFKKNIKGKQAVTPDNFDSLSLGKLVSVKNVDEIKEVLNDKNKTVAVNGIIFFKVEIESEALSQQ